MTTRWYYDPVEAARQLRLIEVKETKMKDEAVAALRELADKLLKLHADPKAHTYGSDVLFDAASALRRAALSAAPVSPPAALMMLFDAANEIHGTLDEQTYDEKRRADWDLPDDHAFEVTITAAHERALAKAICSVEAASRAHLAAPPTALAVQPQQPFQNPHYGMPLPSQFVRKASFTCCGYCRYEEADGELIEQCTACKAIDTATAAEPK